MKIKWIVTMLSLVIFSKIPLYGQEIDERNIWLIPSIDLSTDEDEFTNDPELNALLISYDVTSFDPAFNYAKNPELKSVIQVECEGCDVPSLYSDLEELHGEKFSTIELKEYSLTALYEPIDYLWVVEQDGWLWHLKKIEAQLAWDITLGDPSVKVAVIDTDFDITHPDLNTKISPHFDPYDNNPFGCIVAPASSHGTSVASYVAGETTEIGGTSEGQLASIGFNCMMIGYKAWAGNYLDRALHASNVMNAQIITSSAGGWSYCPDMSGIEELAVKEILDNGTSIVMPAGNGDNGTQNDNCASLGFQPMPFFPLSPYYDERVIMVTSTDLNDNHAFAGSGGTNATHSHYPEVDLCAPGYGTFAANITNCDPGTWPYAGGANGTSFAAPIVAGTAALMYSVNPCMTPSWCQDILKNTTDPVADAANFPGGVGTGRVNAYQAVLATQNSYSATLDLYMKDRPEDFGNETFPYHWQADRDKSPDIWVRNQADGFDNQVHEDPEYQIGQDVYVYVKVRNKSCVDAYGTETVDLHWTKAGTMNSWPQNWDGSDPAIGDLIGSIPVGALPAGTEKIFEFQWTILDPYIYNNWSTCLMARIENSAVDLITIHPGNASDDVFFNNSVALRNVKITNIIPGIVAPAPGYLDGIYYPHGTTMYIGNSGKVDHTFDIQFDVDNGPAIMDQAELKIIFDEAGWAFYSSYFSDNPGFEVIRPREVLVKENGAKLSGVLHKKNDRYPIYVGYSFLTDLHEDPSKFEFHVRQFHSADETYAGGEHFEVTTHDYPSFQAYAGPDVEVIAGNSVTIKPSSIGESALYNWYDASGELVQSSTSPNYEFTPAGDTNLKLEVIRKADGFKDYDKVLVVVKDSYITKINPNPTKTWATVSYTLTDVAEASLLITNASTGYEKEVALSIDETSIGINMTEEIPGSYTISLIADGLVKDTKTLIVN